MTRPVRCPSWARSDDFTLRPLSMTLVAFGPSGSRTLTITDEPVRAASLRGASMRFAAASAATVPATAAITTVMPKQTRRDTRVLYEAGGGSPGARIRAIWLYSGLE